jgi:hypothetical protein
VTSLGFELIPFASGLIQKQAVIEVIKCNDFTANYGLVLTPEQALELVETRFHALSENGRIEFGGGVIDKIIRGFCGSPYISRHNYTQTIHELIEIFYYYKNETLDLISDDDLIQYMKTAFDGICQGSLDLLSGRELYRLARNLRFGHYADYPEAGFQKDEGDDDEE